MSPPQPSAPPESAGTGISAQQARQIVDYHNQKRAEAGIGSVAWSPQIARYAQQRADTIARTKRFAHLPLGGNPYGENLAQGGSSGGAPGFTVIDACSGWYAEKALMPPDVRLMTRGLFNRGVGHYTQMIWKDTTEIGAGIARYEKGGFTWTVVVCCYNPPGNVMGREIW